MKPVYWIIIAVLLTAFAIFWFTMHPSGSGTDTTGTTAVSCGDKTVYRYTNPDEAFPEFTRDYESDFTVTSGVLGKLAGDTGSSALALGVKNIAQALIDTLDQQNIFYQTTLKAYFIESNNDPCNDTLRDKYLSFINGMATDMMNMKGFVSQVTTTTAAAQNVTDTSQKLLAVVDTAKSKVDTSVQNVQQVSSGKMVVMQNYAKLHSAVNLLASKYRINTVAPAKKATVPHH